MPAISVSNLTKTFNSVKALDDISINVEVGEFFGILGPNGAGKTTLLRVLTGQLRPDSGEAQVMGVPCDRSLEIKRLVGIVPEADSPPTFLTTQETLELVCRIRKVNDSAGKIQSWIDFFDLAESRDVLCRDLSKGQRQKVMLASAFIHSPKLLLLDEPFINLDPIYQRNVREHLLAESSKGTTVLLCTHILDMAERLCHRIAFLNKGKVVAQGALADVKALGDENLEDTFVRLVKSR